MTSKILARKKSLRNKRKLRIRSSVFGTAQKPRVSIFRSNRYLYAQAIDDQNQVTLACVDGKKMQLGNNKENATEIGRAFAKDLKDKGITTIVFDRNGYLYHGVVAAFAQSLRDNDIRL
ncbi:50S ribosomal protein L18 [Helicobacter mustelae]|uniref:Large ribosomal subunit protein uL18 n=1 Tax=Helicobacter mustelae (strain ATCC 43772 / CCUG 25715 / CIP 103759 / LMG 18044 / NCTC 12198 / R85-136P) TaxID=679897 RepID=D3UIH3_HELM1|nr:50S ribosomal protein L18 [Helicobacter mustelae]CBG40296.1 50S ribosomal protein L18 [Helicobacter mustelae 12198]SQH71796.1 50S ribosomal protein L18 [Helicobacter mustelae]STP12925.1 50S ribosomal protein L18 [Helicobacter mustelae]